MTALTMYWLPSTISEILRSTTRLESYAAGPLLYKALTLEPVSEERAQCMRWLHEELADRIRKRFLEAVGRRGGQLV
jgi:hypothetical protein